ncbi:Tetrathionate reductase subunit B [hydrothermal vent metagenome]|uniref:Tetrathionate reductase subunit B n=1 Tax=hydrothermal vent metagenome TaxID=652676 RepID=A0A3B0TMW4_9ZZZZ
MTHQEVDLSRRNMIKTTGLGAAVAATAAVLPSQARAGKDLPVQYAMVIDIRRCIGCQACSVACKTEFAVPLGLTRSWVEYVEKGIYPNVTRSFLPRLCNQCSEPACVPVCPTGATYKRKEDGIVVVDADKCIGCKYCIQACPYDARFINPLTGTADKCDFCLHRVEQGIAPSCVNTCQGKARIFGDMNNPESEVAKLIATEPVTVLRQEMGTGPNVYYIGADHADPNSKEYQDHYIRVETHRKEKERR